MKPVHLASESVQWDISRSDVDGDQSGKTLGASIMESIFNVNQPTVEVMKSDNPKGPILPIQSEETKMNTARRIAHNAEVFDQLP